MPIPTSLKLSVLVAAIIPLSACSTLQDIPTERLGTATLSLANGIPAGRVELLANGDELSLAIAVTGLSAGEHGFHLHQTGRCTAPDFKSAGGHLNPDGAEHGELNPKGSHLGDLPNLVARENGSASTTVTIDDNRAEALAAIFDEDGTAVMIHAGPDDYRSDPAGAAGARIACGVLKPA